LDFSGQRVLVTGGTRGIGAALVRAFLIAGAEVTATFATNEAAAAAFEDGLDDEHRGRLAVEQFDVSDCGAVGEFFTRIENRSDRLQVLVNNAGIRIDGVVALTDPADWQRVLDVNLTGAFHLCRHSLRLMLPERYGRIINITSPAGRIGSWGQANYAASKAGLVAFSKSLAREVATRGITVNCVSPGFVKTELLDGIPEDQIDRYRSMVPMGRFGTPEEIAACVLFLASRRASYVTGAVLDVTGGA
jgi:3-oxoacyl-[acyl-carrier protein] reductase